MSDEATQATTDQTEAPEQATDRYWLGLARQAYGDSTDYMDTNLRKRWEKSLNHFLGEHAQDSRYRKPEFKLKANRFYPKTRAVVKAGEAALASALFSSSDLISCDPGNPDNKLHVLSAAIHKELLQYRLSKTIRWFQTAIGAYQVAATQGICISYNWWEVKFASDLRLDADGNTVKSLRVVKDAPRIDLCAPENVRFSPDSDWRDPIQDSPYLIVEVPWRAGDVVEKMEMDALSGAVAPWISYDLAQVLAAGQQVTDTTRQARQGGKQTDPTEANTGHNEFTTVWLRKVFMRVDGVDYLFWTIGDSLLLSAPVPADTVYFHGKRPYTCGFVNLEAMRAYPSGTAEIIGSLQEDLNDIRNQRRENVSLALNRRWFVRRGENIDVAALMRNIPGGGIAVDDPTNSVREISFNDVTSSSYLEQDRIDASIDEISGHFSQASVMTNRAMNETVGGMKMLSDNAFAMQEYGVRIFVETWVEPTLEHLRLLEAYYESDQTVLHLAAQAAGAYEELEQYGIVNIGQLGTQMLDTLLKQDVSVQVNVGLGATDPDRRMNRFVTAVQTALTLAPSEGQRLNMEEVRKEVFSISGQRNGERFFKPLDQVEQPGEPPEVAVARMKQEETQYRVDKEYDAKIQALIVERELGMARIAADQNITMEALYAKLGIEREKVKTTRDIAALNHMSKEADRKAEEARIQVDANELAYKATTGNPGI